MKGDRFGFSIVTRLFLRTGLFCVILANFVPLARAGGHPAFAPPAAYRSIDSAQSLAYQVAMARYEDAAGNAKAGEGPIYDFVWTEQRYRWTWTNDTARLQRVGYGRFMISLSDCVTSFCAQVQCDDAGWPSFSCSDGRSRKMSVGDKGTVIFGDVSYVRVTPLPQ